MGLILPQTIRVKWRINSKEYYESKGYDCNNKYIDVNVLDLPDGSNYMVDYICDYCGKEVSRMWIITKRALQNKNPMLTCSNCNHIKRGESRKGICTISFGDWCNVNNRLDLLNRWDYNLNNEDPYKVPFSRNKKYYFKCPRGLHSSELFGLHSITSKSGNDNKVICKKCNSVAQFIIDTYGDDGLAAYWDFNKNKISPWEILSASRTKCWFICQEVNYHNSYEIPAYQFKQGGRCPFCKNLKVHPNDSFAKLLEDSYGENWYKVIWDEDKNYVNPWEIPKSTAKEVWLRCINTDYHGSYSVTPNKISTRGSGCPFCAGARVHVKDSLGKLYPITKELWSEKNELDYYCYLPHSNKKVWWKCGCGKHEDYYRAIVNSTAVEYRCPECVRERNESFLQEKVRIYVSEILGYDLLHEHHCTIVPVNPVTNHKLPFDNEIVALGLVIEVHGSQHYSLCWFHEMSAKHNNTTPEYELAMIKERDAYKKREALKNGYYYLEIPYWKIKNNKYKKMINESIDEILQEAEVIS